MPVRLSLCVNGKFVVSCGWFALMLSERMVMFHMLKFCWIHNQNYIYRLNVYMQTQLFLWIQLKVHSLTFTTRCPPTYMEVRMENSLIQVLIDAEAHRQINITQLLSTSTLPFFVQSSHVFHIWLLLHILLVWPVPSEQSASHSFSYRSVKSSQGGVIVLNMWGIRESASKLKVHENKKAPWWMNGLHLPWH